MGVVFEVGEAEETEEEGEVEEFEEAGRYPSLYLYKRVLFSTFTTR